MVDLMIVSETSSVNIGNSKSVHTPAVEGSSERIVRLFSYHPLELIIIIIIIIISTTHTHSDTLIMDTLLESPSLSLSLTFN